MSVRLDHGEAELAETHEINVTPLQRAQPLPPFPPDQPGESLELVVPIQFNLKR